MDSQNVLHHLDCSYLLQEAEYVVTGDVLLSMMGRCMAALLGHLTSS